MAVNEDNEMLRSVIELGTTDCSATKDSLKEWWHANKSEVLKKAYNN